MKRIVWVMMGLLSAGAALADEGSVRSELLSRSEPTKASRPTQGGDGPSFSRRLFVVDTSEDDPDESLNRIAGDADPGFLMRSTDFSYESENHYKPGPFARKDIADANREDRY